MLPIQKITLYKIENQYAIRLLLEDNARIEQHSRDLKNIFPYNEVNLVGQQSVIEVQVEGRRYLETLYAMFKKDLLEPDVWEAVKQIIMAENFDKNFSHVELYPAADNEKLNTVKHAEYTPLVSPLSPSFYAEKSNNNNKKRISIHNAGDGVSMSVSDLKSDEINLANQGNNGTLHMNNLSAQEGALNINNSGDNVAIHASNIAASKNVIIHSKGNRNTIFVQNAKANESIIISGGEVTDGVQTVLNALKRFNR
jgi:hypothetical protein